MPRGQIGQDFSNYSNQPIAPQPTPTSFEINIPTPAKFKEDWEKNRAVTIPNLLPDPQALNVWDYYFNQSDDWWDLIVHPDPDFNYDQSRVDNPNYYHMYNSRPGDPTLEYRVNYARNINNQGGFSYYYRRTNNQHPYLQIFQSPKFVQLLESITGYSNLGANVARTFISNYGPGHYNGPHTDGANGRIAFVYHLSKDWLPGYGGLFMGMDWDWKTVNKTLSPPFNTLAIFDTSGGDQGGSPHLVSEIAQGCNNKRISYTGWYE